MDDPVLFFLKFKCSLEHFFCTSKARSAVGRHHRTPVASQKLGTININTDDISPLATLKGIGSKKKRNPLWRIVKNNIILN